MRPLRALFLCGALLVAGCDESVELGHPPPVLVQTDQRAVAVRDGAGRDRLERAIVAIAAGNRAAVHAIIRSRSPAGAAATRRLLVSLGLDPVRIVEASDRGRGAEVVLTRSFALTAPCASAIEPGPYGDPGQSLRSLADCNQTNNLAQMVADPADLVAPPSLGPGDGAYLAQGVRSWREGGHSDTKQQPSSQNGSSSTAAPTNTAPVTTTMP